MMTIVTLLQAYALIGGAFALYMLLNSLIWERTAWRKDAAEVGVGFGTYMCFAVVAMVVIWPVVSIIYVRRRIREAMR
jgi:hypothetical protein